MLTAQQPKANLASVRLALAFASLCTAVMACSCAPQTYRLYPGDPLPKDKIAVLLNCVDSPVGFGKSSTNIVRVLSVGSSNLGDQAPGTSPEQRIEMLPGQYTIRAYFRGSRNENVSALGSSYYHTLTLYGPPKEISFFAKAGCAYEAGFRIESEPTAGQETKWELTIRQVSSPP